MTASGMPDMPPVSQLVVQDLTRAAIFVVATVNPGISNRAAIRSFCNDLPGLVRAVGFRDIEAEAKDAAFKLTELPVVKA